MGHPRSQHFVLESRDIESVTRRVGRWGFSKVYPWNGRAGKKEGLVTVARGGHQPEDFLLPDWGGSPPPRPTPCLDRFQTRRCGVERGGLLHVHVSGLLNAVILML